ncbi:CvpA family protein [Bacillus badius]|uniref:CvpA family protein n=1 Tax=Bacillus badius TaxID=1455 RepID=UPI001CBD022F|nr:CvpA family protein [Bacillus badius]UAT29757.1 CvpA family protein [Bacillus badius]
MIDIILLVLLCAGIIIGLKRGFILQFFHIAGSIIAIIAALVLREQVAPLLKGWIPMPPLNENISFSLVADSFEAFYYGAIAFIIIFILVKIVLSVLGSFINTIAHIPVLREVNKVGGGIFGFVEIYLVLFVLVYLGMLLPSGISSLIADSLIADYMIHHTPYLSDALKNFDPLTQLNRFSF